MEKKLFMKTIEALQMQYDKDARFAESLSTLFPDCSSANVFYDNHLTHNILIEILQNAFNDNHKDSWIEHYCYELDFGRKNNELKVWDKNKKEIPLTTPEDLYNLLISEQTKTSHL